MTDAIIRRTSVLWLLVVLALPATVAADHDTGSSGGIARLIDSWVDRRLAEEGETPAARADDATLLRRVTLDLAGRTPTSAEVTAFTRSTDPAKYAFRVEELLASPDFAYHQRNELDLLLADPARSERGWRDYLLEAARENRPWDQLFGEMVSGCDDQPEPRPSLAFLRSRAAEPDRMTIDTSRLFFGIDVSCAKCHDHPLVLDWTQHHYYGMASFFHRIYLTKSKRLAEKPAGELRFQTVEGEELPASLMYLTGATVEEPADGRTDAERKALDEELKRQRNDADAPPPSAPAFSPRQRLVELALADSEERYFARSIANRLWARLMGQGLVMPLDQMHSSNPPTHPELLEALADIAVRQRYDLKRLIRGIVLSETYCRASAAAHEQASPPADWYAVAHVRPLSPRQLSVSLLVATRAPDVEPPLLSDASWAGLRETLERQAETLAAELEPPGDNFQVGVSEALLFSNGERIARDYLGHGSDRLVGALHALPDRGEQVETAFRAVLGRSPTPDERDAVEAYLTARAERPIEGLQQVVWALIASPEMRFNF